MTLTFGSLFAGVGGFDLGFETAGYECRFQVEWDRHCQQTLAHHWPDVPRWSDVSDVNGADLPPVDVITYGFPCQDLSVAGRRAGLDGKRSHLFFEAVRIITEMREATNGRYPTWAVAENVAGLLNADGGSAMARVVDELAAAGAVVIEWATLDAQWFGVPQRRRRVFIAACFDPATGDRCPDPLFPVAPGSSRNPSTRATAREEVAGTLGSGAGGRGARGNELDGHGAYIPYRRVSSGEWVDDDTGATLAARDYKDHGDLIATPIGFVAEGGTHSVNAMTNLSPTVRVGSTLGIPSPPAVVQPIGFSHTQGIDCQPSTDHFPTLRGEGNGHAVTQPIAFSAGNSAKAHSIAITENGTPPLRAGASGTNQTPTVMTPDLAVRRLTPVECERLMGWPDNHTLHRADGTTNADTTRYKMCGNGVAAPVAQWIAKHLRNTLT